MPNFLRIIQKRLVVLLALALWGGVSSSHAQAASLDPPAPLDATPPGAGSTFDQRAKWLLGLFKDFKGFYHDPKIGLVEALAKLSANGGDAPDAIEFGSHAMDFRMKGDTPDQNKEIFTYPVLSRFLYMYGDRMTPAQREHLKAALLGRAKDLLLHGTENHAIMHISSAYLLAQYFPNETWTCLPYNKPLTSAEMMIEAKNLLRGRGRGFFHSANAEMLSPTYSIINIYPLLNLCEFARDPEVRNAASALAIYELTQIALNDFDGHVMPPYERQNSPQARFLPAGAPPGHRDTTNVQPVMWLLWGQNQVAADNFLRPGDASFLILFALSRWREPALIDRLAAGEGTPYFIRGVTPVRSMQWGEWGTFPPDWIFRTVSRTRQFAIGGGAVRFKPDAYYLDNNMFQIVWPSLHRFNYLECSQPYWRSNAGEEEWDHGDATPFQQMGIGRNSAIVLFDIPAKDPWPGIGLWAGERSQHTGALLSVAQCRFPKSVDELVRKAPWFFIREGNVYIGIRPLSGGPELVDTNPDFHEIKSRAAKTGFVFEAGDKGSRGSFEAFQTKVLSNPLSVDLDNLDVTYTDSQSESLRVKYSQSLTPDAAGWIDTIPAVWNNGRQVEFATSPVIDSPPVTLRDGVLKVSLGNDRLTIDWSGRLPTVTF